MRPPGPICSPVKAWSKSEYSHACFVYCQGFLLSSFLPFRSIQLLLLFSFFLFFQNTKRARQAERSSQRPDFTLMELPRVGWIKVFLNWPELNLPLKSCHGRQQMQKFRFLDRNSSRTDYRFPPQVLRSISLASFASSQTFCTRLIEL